MARGTTQRSAVAAGVAIGSVSLAVGVLGAAPVLDQAQASVSDLAAITRPHVDPAARAAKFDAARARAYQSSGAGSPSADPTATVPPRAVKRARPTASRATPSPTPASRASTRAVLPTMDPRDIARILLDDDYQWGSRQWRCLDNLWTRESNWRVHERNHSSGAYGIPQSLPASKMARFGDDWRDNPVTQIRWGLWYIAHRYGTPCAAWEHSQRYDFY